MAMPAAPRMIPARPADAAEKANQAVFRKNQAGMPINNAITSTDGCEIRPGFPDPGAISGAVSDAGCVAISILSSSSMRSASRALRSNGKAGTGCSFSEAMSRQ